MVCKPKGKVLDTWCITCRIDAGHVVCHVVWKPEGLVACPLEFPLPGSWPYPLHYTVKGHG